MNCPSCHSYQSGNICKLCSHVFKAKKEAKPLKKVSDGLAVKLREYTKLKKQFLLDNPMCKVYPHLKAEDVHHAKGRGKYLLDTTTWIAVSRLAHKEIELNPKWSKEKGFSLERLKR